MKLTLIFRKPTKGQYSIERVFQPLIPIFNKTHEVSIVYLPYHSSGVINLIRNIKFLQKLPLADVFHITGDVHYAAIALPTSKTILTIHDLNSIVGGKGFQNFIKKMLWFVVPLRRTKIISTISTFTKEELKSRFKVDESKLCVIHNPIPPGKSEDTLVEKRKFTILAIGTKGNKNLERLIQSLFQIDCVLLIVGRLSENQINLLEKNAVEFENFIDLSDEEIQELYTKCNLVSFISTYEGFGMPVLEAQSSGRPVLASEIRPIKEIAGTSAEFVDPLNIESIRKGLLKIMQSDERQNELIDLGFENIKRFRPERIAISYINMYNKLL